MTEYTAEREHYARGFEDGAAWMRSHIADLLAATPRQLTSTDIRNLPAVAGRWDLNVADGATVGQLAQQINDRASRGQEQT